MPIIFFIQKAQWKSGVHIAVKEAKRGKKVIIF